MSFERSSFYGTNFDWYAVDAAGHIGQLTTGFGPMPRQLFHDESKYSRVNDYFQSRPSTGSSSLSAKARELIQRKAANFDLHLAEAKRGLFIFDEQDYGPWHYLCAVPARPVLVAELPDEIRDYLHLFALAYYRFGDAESIDVSGHFECVK